MDFEPYFKVHNLVSVHPKSIILGQMTNLNMIFHVVVSVYRLVKLGNSPQFPDEFRDGQYPAILTEQAWTIKALLYGFRGIFSCWIQRLVPKGQDITILPAQVASHRA